MTKKLRKAKVKQVAVVPMDADVRGNLKLENSIRRMLHQIALDAEQTFVWESFSSGEKRGFKGLFN